MINILVTGGKGQLGQCLQSLDTDQRFNFIYTDASDLDITNKKSVTTFFEQTDISWCINCAAYTAVDKAESEMEAATKINEIGAEILAEVCNDFHAKLIHISTDFVFEGNAGKPYNECSPTYPISVYGTTKLNGEKKIIANLEQFFIIRTSWLYSEFGNNFMKTMLRLAHDRDELNVIADQVGSPTYAKDLAKVIVKIIENDAEAYGIYHYSNQGVASWYDFACAIFELASVKTSVHPIPTVQYPTPAQRPGYSVLDKSKISKTFNLTIPNWRESLKCALDAYDSVGKE